MVVLPAMPLGVDAPTLSAEVIGPNEHSEPDAVVLNSLSYAYAGHRPVLSDLSLKLPRGSRCLLIGANGAGECLLQKCSHSIIKICYL